MALLWHQSEEWVWPGGFLPFINREVIGSGEDEFPLDRRVGLLVNTGVGWGTGLAAGVDPHPRVCSFQLAFMLGNTVMHAARRRASAAATRGWYSS